MSYKSNGKSGFILVAVIFLAVFKCYGREDSSMANIFGRSENITIIAKPDSVKAWRTLGSVEVEQWEQGKQVQFKPEDFYVKTGEPVLVSTNLAAKLSRLLLDKDSYPPPHEFGKDCAPEPPVVITFSKGDEAVNIFLCFECKILIVNKMQMQTDFDPGAEAILQVIKHIFPKDRKIQSIE